MANAVGDEFVHPDFECPGYPGDLIALPRGLYTHYAVNVGGGYVVHVTGESASDGKASHPDDKMSKAIIKKELFKNILVCKDIKVKAYVENSMDKTLTPLPVERIIENAMKKIGREGYHVLFNNCEHFARWCRYGLEICQQIRDKVFFFWDQ